MKRNVRGSVAATFLALLPVLGLDGIQAAGGAVTLNTQDFDSLVHLHLLLDNVRSGVLGMLALSSGDMEPEPWVPADVAGYRTVHWDFSKSYAALVPLYNSFRGEGALAVDVEADHLGPPGIGLREGVDRGTRRPADLDHLDGQAGPVEQPVQPGGP